MTDYARIDLSRLRTLSLAQRPSKVRTEDPARLGRARASLAEFVAALPKILFGEDLRAVLNAIVGAHRAGRPVVLGMGAHVIKFGLSPVIIDLMGRGVLTCVAMNGAGPIHDVEAGLKDGVFLKAFTIAQNLGANLRDFTTVNIDMLPHYRPTVNVVQRPAGVGGRGFTLNGRHGLLIPLLAFAVVDPLGG